ncbi:unnamed protein product [Protopolystoma xenopodis]|uniref:Uncharacterized protein n=1 Tax=Protopolystoma xenopodis TaxID=117903 RepID=A0A448X1P4_9PLAT|nr:unnamed protein product [Protopolystoma xenopodis]
MLPFQLSSECQLRQTELLGSVEMVSGGADGATSRPGGVGGRGRPTRSPEAEKKGKKSTRISSGAAASNVTRSKGSATAVQGHEGQEPGSTGFDQSGQSSMPNVTGAVDSSSGEAMCHVQVTIEKCVNSITKAILYE